MKSVLVITPTTGAPELVDAPSILPCEGMREVVSTFMDAPIFKRLCEAPSPII